ncbi:MAG: choice-of-anchor B family protein [Planctomycetes bacterium]|nr:choice-of-anchor B family protein [Planctomycetota bacterium]
MRTPRPFVAVLGLAAAVTASLSAQGVNCALLSNFNVHGPFNDVWGYTAPNGDEYALLGSTTGTVVVDISNPGTPVERGWFPWASSTWRDIRTYGSYAYVVTEATAGFQILDLSNPNSPTQVGIFGTANSGNAHNVCIDVGAGRLYLVGCNTGTVAYDLTANPANPTFLGYALPGGSANYFHDLCVENGYAYGAMIYNGVLRIMDASAPLPWTALSNSPTPGSFTHNCWPNAAGTLCVTTDEVSGGVVKFFDITNKNSPQPRGQFTPNATTIPHNAYLIGDLCHVSWYSLGYRCIDVSDPNNPVEVASYDTYPGTTSSYDGAWGCYPFLPSGNVLISDRSTGLYVVKPQLTDMQITHAPLGRTSDEDGPYDVVATVTSSAPITSLTMNWRVGSGGNFTAVAMTPTGQPNQYGASIPGHDAVKTIEYYLEGVDSAGTRREPTTGQFAFDIAGVSTLFYDGFETDLGWTHGTFLGTDEWQRGAPTGAAGTSGGIAWQDPPAAYAGTNVWGTDLGGPGFNGAYENQSLTYLDSPMIATGSDRPTTLRFRRWLQVAPGDAAMVYVNGIQVFYGQNIQDTSWQQVDIDISSLNLAGSMTVRFQLFGNNAGWSGGWNIDELEILKLSECVPPKLYGVGTAGGSGVPDITLAAPAAIGTTTDIEGSGIAPSAPTFTVLNFMDANQSVFGITALVATPGAVWFGTASAQGEIAVPFTVPNNAALDNLYVYAQMIPVDPAGPQGLAASRGLRFRVCPQ